MSTTKPAAKPTQQQLDDRSNARNANIGTRGTNRTYDHAQGNRGRQIQEHRARIAGTRPAK